MLPPLNADTTRLLCVLAEGGRIEARRTYPHHHNFWLIKADGHKYAQQASELGVATLLERDLIYSIVHDHPRCDEIDYRVTSQPECDHAWQTPRFAQATNRTNLRSTVEIGVWRIPLAVQQSAMGIDWMELEELSEAIPPAYTEHIGKQLLNLLAREAA